MSGNMQEILESLKREIRRSPEYLDYQKATASLNEDGELRARVDNFRRENFYLQSGFSGEGRAKLSELEKENEALLSIPSARAYIKAEQRLCTMIREILDEVSGASGLEIDI